MSDTVFPFLPGFTWGWTRTPQFENQKQRAKSGKEYRIAYRTYPVWRWEFTFDFLRDDATAELQQIVSLFLKHRGGYESFRLLDPLHSTATSVTFGANGFNTGVSYQLVASYDGFEEPVYDIVTPISVLNGATPTSNFTVDSHTGIVTSTATHANNSVAWTGSFYRRVRFEKDEQEFEQFLDDLWNAKKVALVSA